MTATKPRADEQRLRQLGLTPEEFMDLADKAAHAGIRINRPVPPLNTQEREDLTSAITIAGLQWAIVYDINLDPWRNFPKSVYSRMRKRTIDWLRTNRHDPRFGTHKQHQPIDLNDWENPPATNTTKRANPTIPWANTPTDAFIEPDFTDAAIDRIRKQRWQTAADKSGMKLEEWILAAADAAAA